MNLPILTTKYMPASKHIHFLLASLLMSGLFIVSPLFAQDSTQEQSALLERYSEQERTQLKRAMRFTTRKHPGRIIAIKTQTGNPDKYFRIKLLNDSGRMKTYYVNHSITQISP